METIETKKRYGRRITAFALALCLLVGSAFALTPSYSKVSMPDPYGVMPLSMNDDNYSRTLSLNGDIKWGIPSNTITFGGNSTFTYEPNVYITQIWQQTFSSTVGYYFSCAAGSYVDVTTSVSLSASTYKSLVVSGDGAFFMYNTMFPADDVTVYPQAVQVLVNGMPVGNSFVVSYGEFTINDLQVDISSDVTSLGLRFMYTSDTVANCSASAASGLRTANVYFLDDTLFTPLTTAVLPYEPFFERVIAWEQTINNSILSLRDSLSSSLGGAIEQVAYQLSPDNEGTVGESVSNLGSIFARDDDIQLRDDMDETITEATSSFYESSTSTDEDEYDSATKVDKQKVTDIKNISKGASALFDTGYDITDGFTEIGSNDDFLSWFTADTAQALDSTGAVATVGDDDPYNMHFYYDQIEAIAGKRGEGRG